MFTSQISSKPIFSKQQTCSAKQQLLHCSLLEHQALQSSVRNFSCILTLNPNYFTRQISHYLMAEDALLMEQMPQLENIHHKYFHFSYF
jgi:hypothetical protein